MNEERADFRRLAEARLRGEGKIRVGQISAQTN